MGVSSLEQGWDAQVEPIYQSMLVATYIEKLWCHNVEAFSGDGQWSYVMFLN